MGNSPAIGTSRRGGGGGSVGPVGPTGLTTVANFAALAALASAALNESWAYVQSAHAFFFLMASTVAVRTNVRIAASGKAGYQWVRMMSRVAYWEVQPTWVIDAQNATGLASDDNTGLDIAHPLLTWQECSMRLANAEIGQATTITVQGDQQAGDTPVFTYLLRQGGGTMSFIGTPSVVYTSTVTGYVAAAFSTTAADDCQFSDAAVPGGTFTAAGALAKGVLIKRTNGTVIYAAVMKDLGGTTCRVAQPFNPASTIANVAFAAADTYQLLALPKIQSLRFTDPNLVQNAGTKLTSFTLNLAQGITGAAATYVTCYFSFGFRAFGYSMTLQGCCIDTGGVAVQGGNSTGVTMCSFKGTGATTYPYSGGVFNSEGSVLTLQGCQVTVASAVWNAGQINVYDNSNAGSLPGPICVDTGGRWHILAAISGKGCTSKLLCARQSTQIVTANPVAAGVLYTAATTTDALPIQAGATTSAVAIPLDAFMNGVFQTG